jgi:hypothetical protein
MEGDQVGKNHFALTFICSMKLSHNTQVER